ncbi:hypothetical protein SEA_GETALONG_57 [Gordonia phage Getalong]|uniref:Uncharacterized protein n=1 Tax=Gordonia phage Getalong TaxID=2315531 RepID=A0A386KHX1_9CAUD|nr:hypothetical protein HOU38_gp057 [Gordonia phage Getalong]AYD83917.1 hypothetical protein SEA_GETALONG_57 [Gordonia phage Getalong]
MSDASDPVENDTESRLSRCVCGHTSRAHRPGVDHNANEAGITITSCAPPCSCAKFKAANTSSHSTATRKADLPDVDVAEPSHLRFAAAIADVYLGDGLGKVLSDLADRMQAELADAALVGQIAAVVRQTTFTLCTSLGIDTVQLGVAEIGHLDNDFHFMELAHDELTADDMRQVAAAFLAAAQYTDELAGDQS